MTSPDYSSCCTTIVEHIDNGIALLDSSDTIQIWNPFMEKHSAMMADDVIGKNIFDVFPYLPEKWLKLKLNSVKILQSYSFISWSQRPYLFRFTPSIPIIGNCFEYMYQDVIFFPVNDPLTQKSAVCIVVKDVTDVVNSVRKIEEMKDTTNTLMAIANYDPLTSIYNRSYIETHLKQEFSRSHRYDTSFSLIIIDIDHFKNINDQYGHLAGDEVLKKMSRVIAGELRDADIFGRFGGEEFVIILPNTDEKGTAIVAEKLRKRIETLDHTHLNEALHITISQGFMEYYPGLKDYLQMLHEADIALYHSKKNGRNKTSLYNNGTCHLITD